MGNIEIARELAADVPRRLRAASGYSYGLVKLVETLASELTSLADHAESLQRQHDEAGIVANQRDDALNQIERLQEQIDKQEQIESIRRDNGIRSDSWQDQVGGP